MVAGLKFDDLGRIVIPIDIRKNLRIREGDSLEVFVDNDCVCFKKFQKYGNTEWKICANVLRNIVENFAILDGNGNCVESSNMNVTNKADVEKDQTLALIEFTGWNGEPSAYLVLQNGVGTEKMDLTRNAFRTLIDEFW